MQIRRFDHANMLRLCEASQGLQVSQHQGLVKVIAWKTAQPDGQRTRTDLEIKVNKGVAEN